MSTQEKKPQSQPFFTSEFVRTPPLITSDEAEARRLLFTKTEEEKKQLKEAKLNVDSTLATKNIVAFAKQNELGDKYDVTVKFTS